MAEKVNVRYELENIPISEAAKEGAKNGVLSDALQVLLRAMGMLEFNLGERDDKILKSLSNIEGRLTSIELRLSNVESELTRLHDADKTLEERINEIETRLNDYYLKLKNHKHENSL